MTERQALTTGQIPKQFVSQGESAGFGRLVFCRILVAGFCHYELPFHLHLLGNTLAFRGEFEPGRPTPLGEVVIVLDVALAQKSQSVLCRQLPRLDRFIRVTRIADDQQAVVKERFNRADRVGCRVSVTVGMSGSGRRSHRAKGAVLSRLLGRRSGHRPS